MEKEKQQKDQILIQQICNMHYGDIILHSEIETIICEKYGTSKYGSIIAKVKRHVQSRGKMIKSVHGKGYCLVNPDDYSRCAVSKIVSGGRRITAGHRILQDAPLEDMSQNGRIIHRNVSDRVTILHAAITGATVEVKKLSNKNNPLLPENIQKR